jgi:two-component system, LytTR family, response regulator
MITHKTLLLPTNKGKEYIGFNEILRIEALSNYSKIFFVNGKTIVVAKILQWFEDKMCHTGFVRVHRSHLINIFCIEDYNSSSTIMLNDKSFLPISRRKQTLVRRILEKGMVG